MEFLRAVVFGDAFEAVDGFFFFAGLLFFAALFFATLFFFFFFFFVAIGLLLVGLR